MALAWVRAADLPAAELTAEEKVKVRALIQQLGDRSYKARETAANQIVEYGRAAEPLLREALNHPMPEVRTRCARLLPIAMQHDLEKLIKAFLDDKEGKKPTPLAGWERFKEVAGKDEAARELFVDLHRVEGGFMDLVEHDPAAAAAKMSIKCQEFMQARNFGQNVGTPTQVALMLFALLHPKLKVDPNSQNFFSSGLYTMSFNQRGKEVLKENPAVRKMLVQYMQNSHQNMGHQFIWIIANIELKDAADIVRRHIKSAERDPYTRSFAIATLGKIGNRSDIVELLPLLEKTESIGSVQFGNGSAIHTQLRDVALASLILLSGQDLSDYNFAYLKAFNNGMGRMNFNFALSPGMLGFNDDATRTAAIKKWRDWYEVEKKKK